MSTNSIVSEIQLKYKPQPLTETINSAKDIHKLLINRVYDEETIGYKETFKVLLLNNSNKIIGFTTALVSNASAIILTHNHPSGNTHPSCQDDNLTKKIKAACEIMDIRLLDHIIVTPYDSYYSYCDEGRL